MILAVPASSFWTSVINAFLTLDFFIYLVFNVAYTLGRINRVMDFGSLLNYSAINVAHISILYITPAVLDLGLT